MQADITHYGVAALQRLVPHINTYRSAWKMEPPSDLVYKRKPNTGNIHAYKITSTTRDRFIFFLVNALPDLYTITMSKEESKESVTSFCLFRIIAVEENDILPRGWTVEPTRDIALSSIRKHHAYFYLTDDNRLIYATVNDIDMFPKRAQVRMNSDGILHIGQETTSQCNHITVHRTALHIQTGAVWWKLEPVDSRYRIVSHTNPKEGWSMSIESSKMTLDSRISHHSFFHIRENNQILYKPYPDKEEVYSMYVHTDKQIYIGRYLPRMSPDPYICIDSNNHLISTPAGYTSSAVFGGLHIWRAIPVDPYAPTDIHIWGEEDEEDKIFRSIGNDEFSFDI